MNLPSDWDWELLDPMTQPKTEQESRRLEGQSLSNGKADDEIAWEVMDLLVTKSQPKNYLTSAEIKAKLYEVSMKHDKQS